MNELKNQKLTPFYGVAFIWLVVGGGISYFLRTQPEVSFFQAMGGFLIYWGLSIADLFALAQTVKSMISYAAGGQELSTDKRSALLIQMILWGTLKVSCLGLFAFVLLRGGSIPTASLLCGITTLIVVPVLGGLIWSQNFLEGPERKD